MSAIDFSTVPDLQPYTALPPGTYLCRLAEAPEGSAKNGSRQWSLRWLVHDGPYNGRTIFDDLPFDTPGLARLKNMLEAVGIDVSGKVDLSPSLILGSLCFVRVEVRPYRDAHGCWQTRNQVALGGYEMPEMLYVDFKAPDQSPTEVAELPEAIEIPWGESSADHL